MWVIIICIYKDIGPVRFPMHVALAIVIAGFGG